MKLKEVFLIPTGDELASGIVIDTDSPMIIQKILKEEPNCRCVRLPVTPDDRDALAQRIRESAQQGADLIIIIGGSGSGHLHSELLGEDYTGETMESVLDKYTDTALYGKNGHMWSRLVCGRTGKALTVNVPGPNAEAAAVTEALLAHLDDTCEIINKEMADALRHCYDKSSMGRSDGDV
ncbi:MAG: molybdopterin-binding protein [Anaerovoracaceae bacterium]|jgi:molybdopterin biosynthesis enzyme MoaB